MIVSKFGYTQHSANIFASAFVCTNFPVVAKLVPMSVTQVYLQVTKRVQPSFAKAVHCYGIAMPSPLFSREFQEIGTLFFVMLTKIARKTRTTRTTRIARCIR